MSEKDQLVENDDTPENEEYVITETPPEEQPIEAQASEEAEESESEEDEGDARLSEEDDGGEGKVSGLIKHSAPVASMQAQNVLV